MAVQNKNAPTDFSPRAKATRELLLSSARRVLRKKGYAGATVALIAKDAKKAHGTFYLYFDNLEDVYTCLLEDMWEDLKLQGKMMWHDDDPVRSVEVTIERFISSYRANLELWELAEDMSATNPEFRKLRNDHHSLLVRKVARGIKGSIAFSDIDNLEPEVLAEILAGMLESTCRANFRDGRSWPEDVLAAHLTEVWKRALGYVKASI